MDYEKAYNEALERANVAHKDEDKHLKATLERIFPELKESEGEKIRKALIDYFDDANKADENRLQSYGTNTDKVIAWLEKQGEQKPILNVPSREVILAIWDLGNEWKELTNGSISTKYGTQLDYIQKHWNESEYYLREKQDEQNKNNSENYCEDCINRKGCINCENGNLKETEHKVEPKQEWSEDDERMCQETIDWFEKKCFPYALEYENPARESIRWLKSLKERLS